MSTLDNPNVSTASSSIWPTVGRYGLIGGLVFIVYALLGNLTGFARPGAGFGAMAINLIISVILYVGLMVIAIRHFRDTENGGFISFGKAFLIGLGVAVVAGLLNSIFTYFYATVIEPDYFETILRESEEMYERFGMSEEQIEEAMAQAEKSMTPGWIFVQSLGASLVMGSIVAAIVGAVMKRNPDTETY